MSTKATGSLLGPWHHNDIPQHSIKPSTDMNQVIQQANEVDYGHLTQGERLASQLKADLMKNPKFSNPMKMYQDMAAELKAHYPHFGTITTKESSFLLAPATASLLPTYNGRVPLDFLDTVAADDGEEVTIISSVLQGTAKAISGFCRGYASSWRSMSTVMVEIIA
ncbi:hypothetical protein Pmar_PMAR007210 [Perkinsus marinus ATCC 50983]|uniref:Uncharacterized protein n=1 Tax=Perkinsus marinus (strain ATCC 50983 / TXsc) TaxID=423536 RepID=C5LWN4_PERM5|nr:hypothetical protein Pmar_PMAR007210 [Perkinsus marinus ATCC 50983]EEQ98829.1 hypothetical protein Pmar_PMAR007210 [Perkinsus marinus ATCC 50983]|eukprot:XP_002766112.1 hypothetical protein Pmar_PMAR007210 [Perkinsus marinus ATCC 50983]